MWCGLTVCRRRVDTAQPNFRMHRSRAFDLPHDSFETLVVKKTKVSL